ncbi:hypothetical protein LIER_21234 [Lithospermum erythrorhizon]|uniref:C2H2-type domain-containing protein n=1 Tax=Lithospermum erythrorhizon TaxID=34254 RepID=A0AAV3QPK3_LITER
MNHKLHCNHIIMKSHFQLKTNTSNTSISSRDMPIEHHDDRDYKCKYCPKRFYTKQALGGHQNAHTFERSLDKFNRKKGGMNHEGHNSDFYTYHKMYSQDFPNSFIQCPDYLNQMEDGRYHPYPILSTPYSYMGMPMPQGSCFVSSPSNNYLGLQMATPSSDPSIRMHNLGTNSNVGDVNNDQLEETELDLTLKL